MAGVVWELPTPAITITEKHKIVNNKFYAAINAAVPIAIP